MSETVAIKQITMSRFGPLNEEGSPIHLQQGSLDGACGPYCLFMALIICGLVREDDHQKLLRLEPIRKNSATGKALIKMEELAAKRGSLMQKGTEISHLQEIAASHGFVATEPQEARKIFKNKKKVLSTGVVKDFVIEKVSQDQPVILFLDYNGGAHWVVVIGLEYKYSKDRDKKKVSRLLLLDPSAPTPIISAWNSVIDISPRKETHSWWDETGACDVAFHRALAIKRKK